MALAISALCGLAGMLRADVFWRRPAGTDSLLQEFGGVCVYSTDVKVNGTPGTLRAHAVPAAASSVCARLAHRLRLPAETAVPGAAMITHAENGNLRRLLVLPSGDHSDSCVVLSFDQSAGAAARSRQSAAAWPSGIPAFSATPRFTAVCEATRATFVAAETPAAPDEAARGAALALVGAGWTETAPSLPAFKTFVSGRKTCVVLATRSNASDTTTISVLQREGAAP